MSFPLASLPAACTKRLPEVTEAMSALRVWLNDLIQAGLASSIAQSPETYEGMARRLVDAQAPGAARLVRRAGMSSLEPEDKLATFGRIAVLLDAFENRDGFDLDFQFDLWLSLGVTVRKDEIPTHRHLEETWTVAAQRIFPDENLLVQRSWIYGCESNLWLVHLSYKVNTQPFSPDLKVGTAFRGVVARYPGALQLRGVVISHEPSAFVPPPAGTIRQVQIDTIASLSRYPLIEAHFGAVDVVGFDGQRGNLIAVDREKRGISLDLSNSAELRLLAVTAGRNCRLYGEWDGQKLRPSTVAFEGGFTPL